MKIAFIALGLTAVMTMGLITPAVAQIVINNDQSPDVDSDQTDSQTEANFLHAWNRHHDSSNRWGEPAATTAQTMSSNSWRDAVIG